MEDAAGSVLQLAGGLLLLSRKHTPQKHMSLITDDSESSVYKLTGI